MRLLEHHSSPNCISILESADRQRGCASLKPLVQRASQHVLWGAALRHPPSAIRHPVAGGRRAGKPPLLVWPKQLLVNNHNVGDYKMIFLGIL